MGLEQSRYAGGTYEAPRASPLAILFAEDSRVTRQLIHLVLTKRGHQVDAVDDGERALHALQNHAYDVALVDFHLPKLDGLQVVTQFKATSGQDRRHPHFVGFTADIEGLLAHPSNCEILDLVVGKPVDIVHLNNVLEQLQRYVDEGRGHAVQPESRLEGEVGVPSDSCDRRASRRMRVTAGTTTLILQTGERFPCRGVVWGGLLRSAPDGAYSRRRAMTVIPTRRSSRTILLAAMLAAGTLTYAAPASALGGWVEGEEHDACDNDDGAFDEAAFVIATEPEAGERVESGFEVEGCSRSFESNVQWKLIARDGAVLASGYTQGGGVDGPGAFSFTVPYSVDARQIGHLEVFAEDPSEGEGFPPGRTVLPLVLKP